MTPEAFIIEQFFKIPNKSGATVPFKLNPAQKTIDDHLTGRDVIPKARQEGVSTYFLGRYLAACLSRQNVRAVVISHEMEATKRLLRRARFMLENMEPEAETQNLSANEITFPKTGGWFFVGTAGSRTFGRGETITHLHCSEYAFWSNPAPLLSSLLDAVPIDGEVAIESTGNGIGNDYHQRCLRAYRGESTFKCHFLDWASFPEYTLPVTPEETARILANLNPAWEEDRLVRDHHLTAGQLAWRRMKLEEKSYDLIKFKAEYPLTFEECFQASGNSLFRQVNYVPTPTWKEELPGLWQLEGHPQRGMHYSIGADPAGGVGTDSNDNKADSAAAEIVCVETNEQVAEYVNNRIDPHFFGDRLAEIGRLFNDAFITVENNNHGPVTISRLRELYPRYLLYYMWAASGQAVGIEDRQLMKTGFRTTARSKPILIGNLRTALATPAEKQGLVIHSSILKGELDTFIEHEDGSIGAAAGNHDDTVIAIALAEFALNRAGTFAGDGYEAKIDTPSDDPFLLDNILRELRERGGGAGGFPVSSGVLISK